MIRKLLATSLLCWAMFCTSNAQQELGTYFFDGLHQSASLNPAFDADQRIVVGLPSIYGTFHQRGLSISSLFSGQVLDLVGSKKNQILSGAEISAIRFSIKSGNIRYNFAQNYRLFADLQYSNPIISLVLNGNASIIGGKANASPNLNFSSYNETLIGASYHGEQGFSFGVNAKFINGVQNISTKESDFELAVNEDIYQLDITSSLLVNSSFPIDFNKLSEINPLSYKFFPNNFGVAVDLGIQYKTSQFSVAASILDIGYLRWKTGVNNYALEGNFQYDGVKFKDIVDGNFDFVDTLSTSLGLETTNSVYNKFVPSRFYGNFNYNYSPNIELGVLMYGHSSYGQTNGAVALSAQRKWHNKHAVALQYGIIGSNLINLGISGYTTLGPIQLYGVFDNVLGFVNPIGAQNVNARLGINLVFGYKRIQEIRA